MSAMASRIAGFSIVFLTFCPGADQRKHQSSATLASVKGIHRWPMNSPHKGPVARKIFPFDDVIIIDHERAKHFFAQVYLCYVLLWFDFEMVGCTKITYGHFTGNWGLFH